MITGPEAAARLARHTLRLKSRLVMVVVTNASLVDVALRQRENSIFQRFEPHFSGCGIADKALIIKGLILLLSVRRTLDHELIHE